MTVFSTLPPAEQARQLAHPEGSVGLAVAQWLNGNNRQANAEVLAMLDVHAGSQVLEIGFGNGRAAAEVIACAPQVRYVGIDISQTMFDEANRHNESFITAGRASFHLAPAERMPFANGTFDRVFAIGVIHFWKDPMPSLREIHRVMTRGGLIVMQAQDSRSIRPFARPEFGFYLRSGSEWESLIREAGFSDVEARSIESAQAASGGASMRRSAVRLIAHR